VALNGDAARAAFVEAVEKDERAARGERLPQHPVKRHRVLGVLEP
jgi:hypothetical protein